MLSNFRSYISQKAYKENEAEIKKSLQHREKHGEIRMQSTEILAILPPSGDLDIAKIPGFELPDNPPAKEKDFIPLSAIEVTVKARWFSSAEKQSKGSSNANIFHTKNGTFELTTPFNTLIFPTVDVAKISPADLKSYNVTLLNNNNSVIKKYNSLKDKNLYIITYDYSENHLSKYTMDPALGGGWFLEYHDHPHVFKPMNPQCSGATVIGKLVSEDKDNVGTYKFISIQINYPDAIALEGGVIHGNAAFIGPYAISTNPNTHASIAIAHKLNGELQPVAQPALISPLMRLGLFALLKKENALAQSSIETQLVENRHKSPEQQKAYDKHFGLVPLK